MSVSPPAGKPSPVQTSTTHQQSHARPSTPPTPSPSKETKMPKTPTQTTGLSSPPLTRRMPVPAAPRRRRSLSKSRSRSRSRSRSDGQNDVKSQSPGELQAALQEARMTAAHYKLQYQMAQIESVEAIHRMCVENDMHQREQEVLHRHQQQQKQTARDTQSATAHQDPNFRLVHKDVYASMTREIDQLRSENVRLQELQLALEIEHDMTVTSLQDRVALLKDGSREQAVHIRKYRSELRSRQERIAQTALHSPSARRLKALMASPSLSKPTQLQLSPTSALARPVPLSMPKSAAVSTEAATGQQATQAGFDALLQAAETSRPSRPSNQSASLAPGAMSVPTTPQSKTFHAATGIEYSTPRVQRQSVSHLQTPFTAPVPGNRKRSFDALHSGPEGAIRPRGAAFRQQRQTAAQDANNQRRFQAITPAAHKRGLKRSHADDESDATISADDSEAETELGSSDGHRRGSAIDIKSTIPNHSRDRDANHNSSNSSDKETVGGKRSSPKRQRRSNERVSSSLPIENAPPNHDGLKTFASARAGPGQNQQQQQQRTLGGFRPVNVQTKYF